MILDKLHPILRRYRAPAGEGGSVEDRGDSWTPTDDVDTSAADDTAATPEKKAPAKEAAAADAEAEDDPVTEDDPAVETKAEKDDKGSKKDTRMPLSRHKEILERERAAREEAERKLAQYEGGNRIAVINDSIKKVEDKVLAMDKEYSKLVTDGEHEKAASKMREIRELEREVADQKSELRAQAATAQAVEKMRYDITVERLEEAYPTLNPDHDDHDAEVTQDVLDLATTYRTTRRMPPAQAIQKAAQKLLGVANKKQESATEVQARVDKEAAAAAAAKEAKDGKESKEKDRRTAQVAKNVDASKKQPPDTTKLGADSDKAGGGVNSKDIMKMSQDDFAKLDEQTLARMRGDVIA
jgi:hypothetical protein